MPPHNFQHLQMQNLDILKVVQISEREAHLAHYTTQF